MKIYAVTRRFGSLWRLGAALDDQPEWQAHADFMDALAERGIVVMAGPLEGTETALVIVRASSPEAAKAALEDDPWSIEDILPVTDVRQWHVRIGTPPGEGQ